LHALLAARERGIKFDLFEAGEIFKKTPCAAGLNPGGRDVAKDMIEIGDMPFPLYDRGHFDAVVAAFNVNLTDAALPGRQTKSQARDTHHGSGARRKYARQIGSARDGAVTHLGGAHEKQCYADV
jgi:dihydroxyacid dehydratase/phosphogluconate dehydratase